MTAETILVVEDETITALDIEQSLRRKGYGVPGIACTGSEAVTLALQHRPSLILMDIRLKGDINGIEAAKRIQADLNVPIVFLTAYADRPTLERAKSADPSAYLLKPFEEAVLYTTIEIALHKHQAHELMLQQEAEALRLSEARFRHLVENIPDYAVVLLDQEGRILSWSPGAERLHGWCAGEILGKPLAALYPPAEVAQGKPQQDLAAALKAGRRMEYGSQRRKDDARFCAQNVLIALRNTLGAPAGFLKVTREVIPGGEHN